MSNSTWRTLLASSILVTLSTWTAPVQGRYEEPEIRHFPIARLVAKLEAHRTAHPDDREVLFSLARLHAMAFATKRAKLPVVVGDEQAGPWVGHQPRHVPFGVSETNSREVARRATAHLRKAIDYYRLGLRGLRGAEALTHRLGYAWTVDQFGDRTQAIRLYREVFDLAWTQERELEHMAPGRRPLAAEAAAYLVALLEPEVDADEINQLRLRARKLERLPRAVTPILIPLDDEGSRLEDLVDVSARVRFDLDGSGHPRVWAWPRRSAGWLVWDPQALGQVSSGLELFGSVSFFLFWEHGYAALAALDDDGDGWLKNDELSGLAVWRDRDQDGISDAGEVRSLASLGIVGLATAHQADGEGNWFSPAGIRLVDGRHRTSWDWVLASQD